MGCLLEFVAWDIFAVLFLKKIDNRRSKVPVPLILRYGEILKGYARMRCIKLFSGIQHECSNPLGNARIEGVTR